MAMTALASVAACSGSVAEEREHLRYVFDVLLADLLHVLVLLQVVIAVGKGDAALRDDTDLLCGVLLVLLGAEAVEEASNRLWSSRLPMRAASFALSFQSAIFLRTGAIGLAPSLSARSVFMHAAK